MATWTGGCDLRWRQPSRHRWVSRLPAGNALGPRRSAQRPRRPRRPATRSGGRGTRAAECGGPEPCPRSLPGRILADRRLADRRLAAAVLAGPEPGGPDPGRGALAANGPDRPRFACAGRATETRRWRSSLTWRSGACLRPGHRPAGPRCPAGSAPQSAQPGARPGPDPGTGRLPCSQPAGQDSQV